MKMPRISDRSCVRVAYNNSILTATSFFQGVEQRVTTIQADHDSTSTEGGPSPKA